MEDWTCVQRQGWQEHLPLKKYGWLPIFTPNDQDSIAQERTEVEGIPTRSMGLIRRKQNSRPLQQAMAEVLESRVLYSADVLGGLLPFLPDDHSTNSASDEAEIRSLLLHDYRVNRDLAALTDETVAESGGDVQVIPVPNADSDNAEDLVAVAPVTTTVNADSTAREIAFVDVTVPELDTLLAQLERSGIEIILVGEQEDGLLVVSKTLADRTDIDGVHVISHGDAGSVSLGRASLDSQSVTANQSAIVRWGGALSADADILFYGCDLAASEAGLALIDTLASLTGADVAASDDLTGHALLGGDWQLEVSTGEIETDTFDDAVFADAWNGTLATVNVTYEFDDIAADPGLTVSDLGSLGTVTLRQALLAMNNTPGEHTVVLSGKTYELTSALGGDAGGELVINKPDDGNGSTNEKINIEGAGQSLTIIRQDTVNRVINVVSGELNMSSLTVSSGGTSMDGAGINIASDGRLTADDVRLFDNHADQGGRSGGAIYSEGIVQFSNSLIDGNTSAVDGGAIFNAVGASLTIVDSIVSDNYTIDGKGGAIYSEGNLDVQSSLFTGNHSDDSGAADDSDGGAIYTTLGGTLSISDSTFDGNYSSSHSGAVEIRASNATIDRVTFVNNVAENQGGAVRGQALNSTLTNVTFSENIAFDGGGMHVDKDVSIISSTFYKNHALDIAGGLNMHNLGVSTITNTVFDRNTIGPLDRSADVLSDINGNPDANIFSQGFNFYTDDSNIIFNGGRPATDLTSITAAGADLGALLDNGGSVLTHAPNPDSPVINAGGAVSGTDATGTPYDQVPDIGAYNSPAPAGMVFWLDVNGNIFRANSELANPQIIVSGRPNTVDAVRDIEIDVNGERLYWVEQSGANWEVWTTNLDGTDAPTLLLGGLTNVTSIAVNPTKGATEGRLYVMQDNPNLAGQILSYKLSDGTDEVQVTANVFNGQEIEVDASTDTLFWVEEWDAPTWGRVQKLSLSNPSAVATVNAINLLDSPQGLALDTVNQRIYVYDGTISTRWLMNYDGTGVTSGIGFAGERVAFDPLTGQAYVSSLNDDSITLFDSGFNFLSTVSLSDGPEGLSVMATSSANIAPQLVGAPAAQVGIEDSTYSLTIDPSYWNDPDAGDTLSYTVTQVDGSALPGWLSFDPVTRELAGTPLQSDIGVLNVRVIASDGSGAAAAPLDFAITISNVNDTPVLVGGPAAQSATEDTAYSLTIDPAYWSDEDVGDTLTYTVTQVDGSALPGWLTFDPVTDELSGTPLQSDVGVLNVRFVARDAAGAAAAPLDFSITISDANDAPVLVSGPGAQSATEDTAYSLSIDPAYWSDEDVGDTLSYTVTQVDGSALPGWLTFDPVTDELSGTPLQSDVGVLNVRFVARDAAGAAAAPLDFSITISDANDAPVLVGGPAAQSATEDTAYSLTIDPAYWSDEDVGDTLTYTVTQVDGSALPGWLTFDPVTDELSGTPLQSDVGVLNVRFVARDAAGAAAAPLDFSITISDVNDTPVLVSGPAAQSATEDTAYSLSIDPAYWSDEDVGDTLTYTVTQVDGSALPGWLTFDPVTDELSGTPLQSDVGVLNVRFVARDAAGAAAAPLDFSITISDANDTPVLVGGPAAQSATEDTAYSLTIDPAYWSDEDVGDTLTYTVTQVDGSALPGWLTFDPVTDELSGTPLQSDVGVLNVRFVARDAAGAAAGPLDFSITVSDANDTPVLVGGPAAQSATEDSAYSLTIDPAYWSDEDVGDTLTYTVTQVDGSALPSWLTFDPVTDELSGTPLQSDVGVLNVRFVARDAAGAAATPLDFSITISDANDTPVLVGGPTAQSATEDTAYSLSIDPAYWSDEDVGDTLTYTVTQVDGSALPAWLTFDPVTDELSGTPLQSDVGVLNVRIIASDGSGAAASPLDFAITISDANDAPVLVGGPGAQSATEDIAYSLTIDPAYWSDEDVGDTLTYTVTRVDGSALPGWLSFDPVTRELAGTPLQSDIGVLNVRVIASDASGSAASPLDFAITISNVNDTPVLVGGPAAQSATEDTAYSLTIDPAYWSDEDVGDTLSYTVTQVDGSALPGWLTFDPVTRVLAGTPLQSDVGVLNVRVIASDTSGAAASPLDFAVTISNVNDKPVLVGGPGAQSATEDAAYGLTIDPAYWSDEDVGDTLSYTVTQVDGSALPGWLTFDPVTRVLAGTPLQIDVGVLNVRVIASDTSGAAASPLDFAITISNVNDTPVLVGGPAAQSATEDTAYSLTIDPAYWSDEDVGDTLNYTVTQTDGSALPGWLTFDPVTDELSGTPLQSDVGVLNVRLVARDAAGAVASPLDFSITVSDANDTPVLVSGPGAQNATEETAYSLSIDPAYWSDEDVGDILSYTVTQVDGSALPGWLTYDPVTEELSGTPLQSDVGVLNVRVIASDTSGAAASPLDFAITISNVNDTPVLVGGPGAQSALEDTAYSLSIDSAYWSDEDIGDTLSYTVTQVDGSALPGWLTFDPVTRELSGTPLQSDVGVLNVRFVARDVAGAAAAPLDFSITISDANDPPVLVSGPAAQSTAEETPYSLTIDQAFWSDEDVGDTLSYTVTQVDGSALPAWLTFDPVTRELSGTPLRSDVGVLDVRVIASDAAGALASPLDFIITVNSTNNAPYNLALSNLTVAENQTGAWVGTLSVSDDVGDTISFAVSDSRFQVIGNALFLKPDVSFDYETEPAIPLTISANDGRPGGEIKKYVTIRVTDVNEAPVISVVPMITTLGEATVLTIPYDTFTDEDGDPVSYTATLLNGESLPGWLEFRPDTREFVLIDSALAESELHVLLLADDGHGGVAQTELLLRFEPPVEAASEDIAPIMEIFVPVIETIPVPEVRASNSNSESSKEVTPSEATVEKDAAPDVVLIEEIDLQSLIVPIPRVAVLTLAGVTDSGETLINRLGIAQSVEEIDTIDLADLLAVAPLDFNRDYGSMVDALNDRREELAEERSFSQTLVGGTVGITSGFSVGYLIWLIRGGTLMGSMLSSLPAWRLVDPLPVLGSLGGNDDEDDDESLESLVVQESSPSDREEMAKPAPSTNHFRES